jgi:O-antigen/teichoic acid export membrane protein
MLLVGRPLLEALYGADFGPYADLIVPIGTWQVVTAVAIGFTLFLSAAQRGRAILVAGLVGSVGQFVLMTLLAWTSGLRGAAWGLAAGTAAGSATAVALVQLSRRGAA